MKENQQNALVVMLFGAVILVNLLNAWYVFAKFLEYKDE